MAKLDNNQDAAVDQNRQAGLADGENQTETSLNSAGETTAADAKSQEKPEAVKKKDRRKVIRSIAEGCVLLALLLLIFRAVFTVRTYEPYDESEVEMSPEDEDTGFVALSYFGVDRTGTNTLIGVRRLKEHISALSESGYVTITQQDILDYYNEGKELPKKSLFLMFEDGRRDTAIFGMNVTEKYNYITSIMTYAENLNSNDSKMLSPKDLKNLLNSSFCELGTNGYRLEYINVFDRYDNFLGRLDSLEYAYVQEYLGRDYNHYLMDYIRDEYNIPQESYDEMRDRINFDYDLMEDIYTEEMGELPGLYVLMHSNTGQFAENDRVSAVNQENIFELFDMNFNREGESLNTRDSLVYDLTRMQPQPYWHTNHLLMRIWDDTGQDMAWVSGEKRRSKNWEEIDGKAEFSGNEIYLTCEPSSVGTLRLSQSESYRDITVETELTGNKYGRQRIYLRADKNLENYICIGVENNELVVTEGSNTGNGQTETELFRGDLNEITEAEKVSVEEDEKAALDAEMNMEIKWSDSLRDATDSTADLIELNEMETHSVEEGAEEYVPEISLNEFGDRELVISLSGNTLSVTVDGYEAFSDLSVSQSEAGYVYIQSGWGGEAYSQRNLSDDVYDGVFVNFTVTENTGEDAGDAEVLYDNKLHRFAWLWFHIKRIWNAVIDWFIKVF